MSKHRTDASACASTLERRLRSEGYSPEKARRFADWAFKKPGKKKKSGKKVARAVKTEKKGKKRGGYRVLARYKSSSSTAVHEVRRGGDGKLYCTCRGWAMSKSRPRSCRHLRDYLS